MKICVISPFEETGDTYPQVAYLSKLLRERSAVNWVTISERGFRIDRLADDTFLGLLNRRFPRTGCSLPRGSIRLTLRTTKQIAADLRAVKRAVATCDVVLALDFMALVLASALSWKPVVLWSHDFISEGEERHRRTVNRLWMQSVRRALYKHKYVIVQDVDRCHALERSLGLKTGSLSPFYFPVSLPPVAGPLLPWSGKPRVMQIGGLSAWRSHTDFLLDQYRLGHNQFELMLHGGVSPDIVDQLNSMNPKPTLDEQWVDPEHIPSIVNKCSVGFVGYVPTDSNFFFMKNASGQLVEFLRCGKPVLTMGVNNIAAFLEEEVAGCGVANSAEFFSAIEKIHCEYSRYSHNAKNLFNRYFDINQYVPGLIDYLQTASRGPLCPTSTL